MEQLRRDAEAAKGDPDVRNDGGPPRPSKSATVADINFRSKLLELLVLR
jgi:hypothetical protein